MKARLFSTLVIFVALLGNVARSNAQGTTFTYQGRLNVNGLVANGTFDLSFGLYLNSSGGSSTGAVITNTAVAVSNGLFTTTLNFGDPFNGAPYWLEIGVRTNGSSSAPTILSPRQPITPSPYAITASNLSGTVALTQLPATLLTNNGTNVKLTGMFLGDGSGLSNLNAAASGLATTSFVTASVNSKLLGTSNFIAKFTSNGALSNSLVYDNGTNVGIGTTNPGFPLHVTSGLTTLSAYAENTSINGTGLYAFNVASANTGNGSGLVGSTSQSGAVAAGVFGQNFNTNGIGISGINAATSGLGSGIGVFGRSDQFGGAGVYGRNNNTNGTGVVAAGNGVTAFLDPVGSGVAASGFTTAFYGVSTAPPTFGSSVIYTTNSGTANTVVVNYYNGTVFKVAGNGVVSTLVSDTNNHTRVMFAPEAPEVLFEDYGSGQLTNGGAHIALDTIFAENIMVDDTHPLRVFVQVEGDCQGVYVTNKSDAGFDVKELAGGTSGAAFSWHAVGNRADEEKEMPTSNVAGAPPKMMTSRYATLRFPVETNLVSAWHSKKMKKKPGQ